MLCRQCVTDNPTITSAFIYVVTFTINSHGKSYFVQFYSITFEFYCISTKAINIVPSKLWMKMDDLNYVIETNKSDCHNNPTIGGSA